eukprot:TRINITY_DN3151_c0_g1_i4.p1 TRINITY_DN3151_c0_g1~~TRINITY_DN3151_c0_g1_i4.p1  ORF type:complete len:828 (-),score=185.59 TRINITY_DN3151_c0_g1_i4:1352-3835(-)
MSKRVAPAPISTISLSPLLPVMPGSPQSVDSPTQVVNTDDLARNMASFYHRRGGLTVKQVVLSIILADLLVIGLLVVLYYVLYLTAPSAVVPLLGLTNIYVSDLNVGDFTINSTSFMSLRNDTGFNIYSRGLLNITSHTGNDIVISTSGTSLGPFAASPTSPGPDAMIIYPNSVTDMDRRDTERPVTVSQTPRKLLSTPSVGRVMINNDFVFSPGVISVTSASGLQLSSPSTMSISSTGALQLNAGSVSATGALSVQGALSASSAIFSGTLSATGSISSSGGVSVTSITSSGGVTAASVSTAGTITAAAVTTASVTSASSLQLTGSVINITATSGNLVLETGSTGAVLMTLPVGIGAVPHSTDGIVVNGPIRIAQTASFPACAAQTRGVLRPTYASAGSADTVQVCAKNSSDLYAYQDVSYANAVTSFMKEAVVAQGEAIAAGDPVSYVNGLLVKGAGTVLNAVNEIEPVNVTDTSTSMLSSQYMVVAYSTLRDARVRVATLNPVTLAITAFSSPVVVTGTPVAPIKVAVLSSTSFVVLYTETSSQTGYGRYGTWNGTLAFPGAAANFSNGQNPGFMQVAQLTATQYVVVYRTPSNNNYGAANVGTVSGNIVSHSPQTIFNLAFTKDCTVGRLSSTQILIAFQGAFGMAMIASISNGMVVAGPTSVFTSASSDNLRAAILTPSSFVLAWAGAAQRGTAMAGVVSGSTITFSYPLEFNSFGGTGRIEIAPFTNTTFVMSYESTLGNREAFVQVGEIVSSGGVVFGYPFIAGFDMAGSSLTPLSNSTFAISNYFTTTGQAVLVTGYKKGGTRVLGLAQTGMSSVQRCGL